MSLAHTIILIIIAVIVIPPEKLPEFARQAARFFNDLRRTTSGFWDDVKKDALVTREDLELQRKAVPPPAEASDLVKATTPDEIKKHDS